MVNALPFLKEKSPFGLCPIYHLLWLKKKWISRNFPTDCWDWTRFAGDRHFAQSIIDCCGNLHAQLVTTSLTYRIFFQLFVHKSCSFRVRSYRSMNTSWNSAFNHKETFPWGIFFQCQKMCILKDCSSYFFRNNLSFIADAQEYF